MSGESRFLHGVASGDPLPDGVILWTRLSPPGTGAFEINWQVSLDPAFNRLVASGTVSARAEADFCVHVDVGGLSPNTHYFYRFTFEDEVSRTGKTKTLPAGSVGHLRFAQVSCAKFNAGYFNAYGCIAAREDLDFLLHLGDYIYEAANTPPPSQTPGADIGRPFEPLHECKSLVDYRLRYNQYHRDPDVQRMHASLPVIATVDDHEFADGAWKGGASEHKPERDGDWQTRKAAAFQARWEWLPARMPDPADPSRAFRTVHLGNLADLFLIDTRTRRDEPAPPPTMNDPARSALGVAQCGWLFDALQASRAAWRLLGNPSVLATTWRPDLPAEVKEALVKVKLIDAQGSGPDYDQWDGYPVERDRLLALVDERGMRNLVVLSGDVHVSLAIELKRDGASIASEPLAVEFVNPSLTSQNLDEKMGWAPRTKSLAVEEILMQTLPHIHWCDLDSHGYNVVDVTPERVRCEWWAVESVLYPSSKERLNAAFLAPAGSTHLQRLV